MIESLTKEELLKFSILGRNIKKIDIANEINLYQDPDYIEFTELFKKIIKNKYLKYGVWLKCHTHLYQNGEKIRSLNISCSEFLGNNCVDIFELRYEDDKFRFKKGFESYFELLNTRENSSLNNYFKTLEKINLKLENGVNRFLNKETLTSVNFHKNIVKYKEKTEIYEKLFTEILNEEKTFLKLKKGLERFFNLEKDFNIYVNISSGFEYDRSCKGNIDYEFIIDIRTVYAIERVVTLEFPRSFSLGTYTYSASKNTFKWKPNLFNQQKYLSNKIAVNNYTKKVFPKIFKETLLKEFD